MEERTPENAMSLAEEIRHLRKANKDIDNIHIKSLSVTPPDAKYDTLKLLLFSSFSIGELMKLYDLSNHNELF